MQIISDEDIVDMLKSPVKEKQSEALNYLYDKMFPSIARFILNNSGQETDAKDLFQDSMIVLYEKIRSSNFELTGTIKSFLHAVCRNLWLKRLRKSGKELSTDDVQLYAELTIDPVNLEQTEEAQEFAKLLNKVGESCQQILMLFYYERLSMKAIAKKLGLANEGVAKNKKARCIQKLKKLARLSKD